MARNLIGIVSSDQRDKTITVTVASRETHALYKKQFTRTRKYTAHDAENAAKIGDKVMIAETRPISKTKTWTLVKILEKSRGKINLKDEVEAAAVLDHSAKAEPAASTKDSVKPSSTAKEEASLKSARSKKEEA